MQEQLARGAPLYTQNCATANCHGTKGEGLRAGDSYSTFPLVGREFANRNPSVQIIFDVVRSGGEQNLRALTDQQIYDAIAFELSQNNIHWPQPMNAGNAAMISSGATEFVAYSIYPPLTNAVLQYQYVRTMTGPVSSSDFRLQLDQFGEASRIGSTYAPDGGAFVIVVFTLFDFGDKPIQVEPRFLHLKDSTGKSFEPLDLDLGSPIERLHVQMIEPQHSTAAIAVFAMPTGVTTLHLVYEDESGTP